MDFETIIKTYGAIGAGGAEQVLFSVDKNGNVNIPSGRDYKIDGVGINQRLNELFQYDDKTEAPGNKNLIAGTMQAGFFGEVSASELISGDALASLVGISEGTSQFSDAGWLKVMYQNKICFISKKPIRRGISWDAINAAGAVFGTATVDINGLTYKVRLMTGAMQILQATQVVNGIKSCMDCIKHKHPIGELLIQMKIYGHLILIILMKAHVHGVKKLVQVITAIALLVVVVVE